MKEHVYRFRAIEQRIMASKPGFRVLDLGCGPGDNLRRLSDCGGRVLGIEPNKRRAHEAQSIAPVAASVGEATPFSSGHFDMVYISHVLHHAVDVEKVLREAHRLLVPGGLLFVIESIDDSPLMRLARAVQPSWYDDAVLNRFRYRDLLDTFGRSHFKVLSGGKFNWMYFCWELLPLTWRRLELFTPLFIVLEAALHRPLGQIWGGHCWLISRKPGPPVFPVEG